MDTGKKICVFSLSKEDIFTSMEQAKNWLINKGEKPYYFREKAPTSLPSDSIVLFSFEARVFGQAKVKKDVAMVPFEEQENWRKTGNVVYKHYMIFNGDSIEVFRYYPTKRDITENLNVRFAQLFTYLNYEQYQKILKMARMQ